MSSRLLQVVLSLTMSNSQDSILKKRTRSKADGKWVILRFSSHDWPFQAVRIARASPQGLKPLKRLSSGESIWPKPPSHSKSKEKLLLEWKQGRYQTTKRLFRPNLTVHSLFFTVQEKCAPPLQKSGRRNRDSPEFKQKYYCMWSSLMAQFPRITQIIKVYSSILAIAG